MKELFDISTPSGRTLNRVLNRLKADLPARALELRYGGETLTRLGEAGNDPGLEIPFSSFLLLVHGGPPHMDPSRVRLLRSARRLVDILIRAFRGPHGEPRNGIAAGFVVESYMEILRLLEERRELVDFYESMLELNRKILMAEDLFTVLQVIMDTARDALRGEGSSLLLVDQKTGEMYFNVVSGERKSDLREIRIPAGEGIAGDVVKKAKAEIISDVKNDPRAFQRVDMILKHTTRDMIVAPIIARGAVIGVIEVINSRAADGFHTEDLALLERMAGHTSLFIENMKGKEDLVRTNRKLDRINSEINALYEIGRVLNTSLEANELKRGLLRTMLRVMKIGNGAILEKTADRRLVETIIMTNQDDRITELDPTEDGSGYAEPADILLWMQQYKEPFYFIAPSLDRPVLGLAERFKKVNAERFGSSRAPELWAPIIEPDGNEINFVLALGDIQLRRRDPVSDVQFFQGLMNLCQTAFRNVASYRAALEARGREEQIRRAFQKYVPARVVSDLVEEENPPPTVQTVSVLFADIRNFSALAEKREPADLALLLNEFFEAMVGVVTAHDGIVDKFMGDSLMALFGVPDPHERAAESALRAAMEMQVTLTQQNEKRRREGRPTFDMGIGLHTGPAIVGSFGSRQRLDFTALGDTVNLASRLEKAAKHYRAEILFTGQTLEAVGDRISCREVDLARVRGRSATVQLFQPFAFARYEMGPTAAADLWHQGIRLYRERRFQESREAFATLSKAAPGLDPLTAIYLKRTAEFERDPPPADWQGIFAVDA
ncbi:MAG: GAF domain-containing protein [Spirochaetales bacterium]|nr:GAF domain-containing protein [Leptospiraceae bacterium]MCP5481681.1 GAF domain-containing protein [Spirochaetales bacterium]